MLHIPVNPLMTVSPPGGIQIGTPPPMPVAIRWNDGQAPDWLLAPGQNGPFPTSTVLGCDADCRLIFGHGRASVEAAPPPGFTESWYRTPAGEVVHIEEPVLDIDEEGINGISLDIGTVGGGTGIAAGYYVIDKTIGTDETDIWLWTQNTGAVDLRPLIEDEYGFASRWNSRYVHAISADGSSLLILDDSGAKAAVLRLIPKTAN